MALRDKCDGGAAEARGVPSPVPPRQVGRRDNRGTSRNAQPGGAEIGPMQVKEPSGRAWTVKRQLLRFPRWRGFGRRRFDVTDGVAASSGGGGLGDLAVGVA